MASSIALALKYPPCLDSLVRRDAQKPEYSLQRLVVALRKMLAANEQHLARTKVTVEIAQLQTVEAAPPIRVVPPSRAQTPRIGAPPQPPGFAQQRSP